jgi:hypothetical protein
MRIILRGGPLTGEVRHVVPAATAFTTRIGPDDPVAYDATGQDDRETGLPIFVYRMPLSDPG